MKLFASAAAALLAAAVGLGEASACGCCCRKKPAPAKAPDKPPAAPAKEAPKGEAKQVTVAVTGMTCNACAAKVQKALAALPWVRRAEVDLKKGQAAVTVDPARYDEGALLKAVKDAGYGGKVVK